uniref:Cadherin domain-containing protein n=1 Tax=Ascaris lumbricoides TaxID=6252 RepID=A0A0M3HUJ1_ASCLU
RGSTSPKTQDFVSGCISGQHGPRAPYQPRRVIRLVADGSGPNDAFTDPEQGDSIATREALGSISEISALISFEACILNEQWDFYSVNIKDGIFLISVSRPRQARPFFLPP